ncbi:MAG: hypothetical protein ACM3L9_03615, partial [Deltaproteobacteria bacterium]
FDHLPDMGWRFDLSKLIEKNDQRTGNLLLAMARIERHVREEKRESRSAMQSEALSMGIIPEKHTKQAADFTMPTETGPAQGGR